MNKFLVAFTCLLLGTVTGCPRLMEDKPPAPTAEVVDSVTSKEDTTPSLPTSRPEMIKFSHAYLEFFKEHGEAPKSLEDLKDKAKGFPGLAKKIDAGTFVIVWRADLNPNAKENEPFILGHDKNAGKAGGMVLQASGGANHLTAGEFGSMALIKSKTSPEESKK